MIKKKIFLETFANLQVPNHRGITEGEGALKGITHGTVSSVDRTEYSGQFI
jgi:hypothetical protein